MSKDRLKHPAAPHEHFCYRCFGKRARNEDGWWRCFDKKCVKKPASPCKLHADKEGK